ncbi:Chorismate synthase [Hondaea fermentalgiana]|uniref:chorismate synthase n=1 Tax=Hondaea fermentalgiana TaxID=2315210 RepID=A0A2R5G1G2_9STRA|nr:Chorismate synthase [Hondaea fermentalgiana]|eukprot:GBG24866.1 Chorismate synthase [Hondaea fermentalgiana]
MSTFGRVFRATTFGESHAQSVGVIIDGCPPGMRLTEADVQPQLTRRRPGQSKLTTPRDEKDAVTIKAGTECGFTLGTPLFLCVDNLNVRPGDYKEMSKVPRPGHADLTYQIKYGIRATSGGGRSSARETIGRVAAGAVADKWLLETYGTTVVSFVHSIGDIKLPAEGMQHPSGRPWTREEVDAEGCLRILRNPASGWRTLTAEDEADEVARAKAQKALDDKDEEAFLKAEDDDATPAYVDAKDRVYTRQGVLLEKTIKDVEAHLTDDLVHVRCPHAATACRMSTLIRQVKSEEDSIGGTVACVCSNVPAGLGEPCFDKLEAMLAHGVMSLPATKGFEIGSGFEGTKMRGSQHNDPFEKSSRPHMVQPKTNNAGGTLGGISSGADIVFRVAVKAVSTIGRPQQTVDFEGNDTVLEAKGRHDPCVLPRTPPLIEAMTSLTLIDAAMLQRTRVDQIGSQTIPSRAKVFEADPSESAKLVAEREAKRQKTE